MKTYIINDLTKLDDTMTTVLMQSTPSLGILENNIRCVFRRPNDDRVNLELCNELEIPVIPISSTKGAVISNINDIAAMVWIPGYNVVSWGAYIFNRLAHYLTGQHLKMTLVNNDILLYGKKIGGYSEEITARGVVGVLFIAMEDAQELVNQICLKHTDKKTAGLHNYGITNTEIKDLIIRETEVYLTLLSIEGGK
jgi:hypothetical protein